VVLEDLNGIAVLLEDVGQTPTTDIHVIEVSLPCLHPNGALIDLGNKVLVGTRAVGRTHPRFIPERHAAPQ
jgi:hypothetical protein